MTRLKVSALLLVSVVHATLNLTRTFVGLLTPGVLNVMLPAIGTKVALPPAGCVRPLFVSVKDPISYVAVFQGSIVGASGLGLTVAELTLLLNDEELLRSNPVQPVVAVTPLVDASFLCLRRGRPADAISIVALQLAGVSRKLPYVMFDGSLGARELTVITGLKTAGIPDSWAADRAAASTAGSTSAADQHIYC